MAGKALSGGAKLRQHLAALQKQASSAQQVEVGFLPGPTEPDGTSVATVAAIQEFGAPARGIPARPFFRNMLAKESGHWGQDLSKALTSANYDAKAALATMGKTIAAELTQSMDGAGYAPLAPSTVVEKGESATLVAGGQMKSAIDFEVKP